MTSVRHGMSKSAKKRLSYARTTAFLSQLAEHRRQPTRVPAPRMTGKPKRKYGW
jgi:hypothetical protein